MLRPAAVINQAYTENSTDTSRPDEVTGVTGIFAGVVVSQPNNEGAEGVEVLDVPLGLDQHEEQGYFFIVTKTEKIAALRVGGQDLIVAFTKGSLAMAYSEANWPGAKVYGPANLSAAMGAIRNDRARGENAVVGIYFPETGEKVLL